MPAPQILFPTNAPKFVQDIQVANQPLPGDTATQTHAASVLTNAALPSGYSHVISEVTYSYTGGTPAGGLTIADGSTTVFQIAITAAGVGTIRFDPPLIFTAGNAVTVTLADGGASIVGDVNQNHWIAPYTVGGLAGIGVYPGYDYSNSLNSDYLDE